MNICFIGGDRRMLYTARRMAELHPVRTYGLPQGAPFPVTAADAALAGADFIILPLPATRDGLHPRFAPDCGFPPPSFAEIFAGAGAGARILGGALPEGLIAEAQARGLCITDYYTGEPILLRMAEATAEAAVGMAIAELPVTLAGSEVAIVGYGRIGRALLRLLLAFRARVTVYARAPTARADAEAAGARVLPCPAGEELALPRALRAVFHTAPAPLFWNAAATARLPQGCLLLDLAGGALDTAAADACGILHPSALALPGRFSPESAGDCLFEEILTLITPEGGAHP